MIVNNSQNIQSNNPLGSISSRRVSSELRSSNTDPEDKQALKAQQQQDEVIIRQLRSRDREVRAHEGAHVAAGGSIVRGGPSYTYQTGPDGRSYAIGGEVQIDTSPVADDPEATLIKSGQIRTAALAPANPSSQDLRVAANANQLASRARIDIAVLRREEVQLVENQRRVGAAEQTNESQNSNEINGDAIDSVNAVVEPATAVSATETVSLQSNDVPIAAINAFMATANAPVRPVLFNQYA